MTTRLPLAAAQLGIWMAERLHPPPGAWSVAHYAELRGALDPDAAGKSDCRRSAQADTLSLQLRRKRGGSLAVGWRPTAPWRTVDH
ncbi:hypothetical protein MJ575_08605 [Klebsiella pneumoniae]|nr:hypothetical protein MJ575_08605 [Klebsiella pneumoniae]